MGDIIHQGGQYSLVNIVLGGHYSLVNNVRGGGGGGQLLGGTIFTITTVTSASIATSGHGMRGIN